MVFKELAKSSNLIISLSKIKTSSLTLQSTFVTSITNRDYPTIMAVTIFLAMLMVVANLLTDIVYKLVDPRIKLD